MKTEDELLDMLLGAQQITPSQFHDRLRRTQLEPEQRLLAAVLEDAIRESRMTSNGVNHRQLVIDWVNGADCDVPFELCCNGLGLEISYARPRFLLTLTKSTAKDWAAVILRQRSGWAAQHS